MSARLTDVITRLNCPEDELATVFEPTLCSSHSTVLPLLFCCTLFVNKLLLAIFVRLLNSSFVVQGEAMWRSFIPLAAVWIQNRRAI